LLRQNFEKLKRDTDALVTLARALQAELLQYKSDVLSVELVEKTKRLEKLAKEIRQTAQGMGCPTRVS
jgi:hypothetical protein